MADTRKRKPGTGRALPKEPSPITELVVRRGALRRFDALKRETAGLPVNVTWDRRKDDRRSSSDEVPGERRKTDRRQKPSFTWDLAEFVVVPPVRQAAPSRVSKKRGPAKRRVASR